jgi:hypothetical protein
MNLGAALERRAERGTPSDPDEIYAAAVADSARARPTRERGHGRRSTFAAAGVVAVTVGAVLGAQAIIDDGQRVNTRPGPQPTVASTTLVPPVPISVLKDMKRVTSNDVKDLGWVTENETPSTTIVVNGIEESVPLPVPVFGDDGHQIAWWGFSLGWIDLDQMTDPGFDYLEEHRTRLRLGQELAQRRGLAPNTAGPVEPLAPDYLLPVGSRHDRSLVGFVRKADHEAKLTEYRLVPVVDLHGEQIAWWATGVGWLSFEDVAAEEFDLRQKIADSGVGFGTLPTQQGDN